MTSDIYPVPQTGPSDRPLSAGTTLLEACQLGRELNGRAVLQQVDFTVQAGECVALLGDNGAGKTTLLRCLAGRLRPTSGEVLWLGMPWDCRLLHHRQIGFVAHERFLYAELTAEENLLFAARMYGMPRPKQRVAELLKAVALERRSHQAVGRMSQGMAQRLSLARALIHDPPVVILDEPFSGLDSMSCLWLSNWLGELRERGRAIVLTSHDEVLTRRLANRQCRLREGCLVSADESAQSASCLEKPLPRMQVRSA